MARFDDAESAKKIRKAPQTILCGIALENIPMGGFYPMGKVGIIGKTVNR